MAIYDDIFENDADSMYGEEVSGFLDIPLMSSTWDQVDLEMPAAESGANTPRALSSKGKALLV